MLDDASLAVSRAGEARTLQMARLHFRIGRQLLCAGLWSAIGTTFRAIAAAADRHDFFSTSDLASDLARRAYGRCSRRCAAVSHTAA